MTELQLPPDACWALALGGTRRAYVAAGGTFSGPDSLTDYFGWIERAQQDLLDRLFDLGVSTIVAVQRIPSGRGARYTQGARSIITSLLGTELRQEWYARRGLRVTVAGDQRQIEESTGISGFAEFGAQVERDTAGGTRGRLVYFFRGDWADETEEAAWGYRLGSQLGRPPTRAELVEAFYHQPVPPLSLYLGSGRPQLLRLRPPFISGAEDCYWSANCPVRLRPQDWQRLVADHLTVRRTSGNRSYPDDPQALAEIAEAVKSYDGLIVGMGRRHQFGFWLPDTQGERAG
jgi:hypothetical protein